MHSVSGGMGRQAPEAGNTTHVAGNAAIDPVSDTAARSDPLPSQRRPDSSPSPAATCI